MKTVRAFRPLPIAALAAILTLGGCSSAAAPSAPPSASPPAQDLPASVAPGGGDGTTGNPGTGIINPDPAVPGPVDPGVAQPKLVVAKAGQLNPHPVTATNLQASVDGRRVLVKVSWYSGVEPCNVLDSVKVERDGTNIAITPIEGMGDPNAVCMELAVLKATIVDLGELEPGTYTISAPNSEATPIEITVA